MIQLLIGPYRSGKTGRMLKELIDFKRQNPLDSCLILVPSQRYGSLLREQLVALLSTDNGCEKSNFHQPSTRQHNTNGIKGIFGVRIATIYEACEQIIRNAGTAPNIIPRELCVDLVAEAMSRLAGKGQLEHLKPIAAMRGTASALYRLIDEFERAALTPMEVMSAVLATGSSTSRYHELAMIYRQYWSRLDELKATDQKRMAFTCRELLAPSRKSEGWAGAANSLRMLIVDGFDRISPLQAEVIHALSQHANHTFISFDYVLPEYRAGDTLDNSGELDDDDEYAWKDSSYNELQSRFSVEPEITARKSNMADSTNAGKTPGISGFRAIERFFEAEELARRCKQLVHSSEIALSDVLVVSRDIAQYSEAIRNAFNDAGIPFYIDEAIEHQSLPLAKFLTSLFSLGVNDFPRRQLMDCLRSPFFNLAGIGLSKADVEALDRKSLKAGLLNGRERWQQFLDKDCKDEIAIKFDAFLDLITPKGNSSVTEHCRWIEDRIELLRKPAAARTADDIKVNADHTELEALAGFRAALNILLQKEQVFHQTEVGYSQFLCDLQSLLEQSTLRRQPANHEAVYICSAEHAPNRRFDCVFIAGVLEGDFPKRSGESGFLSSEERARWCGFGVKITNPREEPGFEKALFKSLIERARKQVTISAPCVNLSGDELFPSFYLTDGTIALPSFDRVDVCRSALLNPMSARESIAAWLWHKPGIEPAEHVVSHEPLAKSWDKLQSSLFGSWSRHQSTGPNEYTGRLTDITESGWLTVKTPSVLTASALNNYGQCPFKFWLTNLLNVRPRDEPEPGLNAKFKGNLFHRALEIYYSQLVQIPPGERAQCKDELLDHSLAQAVQDLEQEPQFHPSLYWENEQKELLFRLKRFIEYDEARALKDQKNPQPALFEVKFGMPANDASYPPLVIDTADGPISVRGIIDRLDIEELPQEGPGSYRQIAVSVIDYKTGSTPITAEDIAAFAQIQLPLYAMAVEKCIVPGAKVTTGQYLSVNAAKSIGSINFTAERWTDLIRNARERIRQSLEMIGRGDFSVRPYASKACNNCDHASVCRVADMKELQFVGGES